jgi:hypothetical protein
MKEFLLMLGFVVIPFAVGTVDHYFDPWVSVPFTLVMGLYWLGILMMLKKEG